MNATIPFDRLPIPHRIAGFTLTATLFILVLLERARHNLRGEIIQSPSTSSSLRPQSYYEALPEQYDEAVVDPLVGVDNEEKQKDAAESYYVFLQKFPLQSSFKMLFHTEVLVCPRGAFANDVAFLDLLDGTLGTITPSRFDGAGVQEGTSSPFAVIEEEQWSKQSEPGCVQLGYGAANCGTGCCGSPSRHENRNYALSSRKAVISNAMGEYKELYLYGVSVSEGGVSGISGEDAYKAVCHGHMNAVEMAGGLPKCVSDWAGRDYNPITNNCNTFTSTVLKCVYGLSDAKPKLGVSDLRDVRCPTEKGPDGREMDQCVIPSIEEVAVGNAQGEAILSLAR